MTNFFLITLLLLAQIPGYHPELLPRPFQHVEIKGEMSLSKEGYFIYSYKVYNPPQNNGRLIWIDIDIKKGGGTVALHSEGLPVSDKCTGSIARMNAAGSIVPVAIDSPPNWLCSIGTDGMGGWASKAHDNDLLPGQTLSGFVMTSYGLPAIKDIIAQPLIVNSVYPNIEEFDVDMDELRKVMLQDKDKVSFKGKTIGPTAPPADFKPIDFLDYIVSLKHQAYGLGWIVQGKETDKDKKENEEKGIMKSLDQKLSSSRERLEKGDYKEAVEKLKSFVHEVEALYKENKNNNGRKDRIDSKDGEEKHHEHLTSEAYALLKYNAQYLIDQIGGVKKERNEKKD